MKVTFNLFLTALLAFSVCAEEEPTLTEHDQIIQLEETPTPYTPPPNTYEVKEVHGRNLRALQETCFKNWELSISRGCNYESLVQVMSDHLFRYSCSRHDPLQELKYYFGVNTEDEVRDSVHAMCRQAHEDKAAFDNVSFSDITKENEVFDKAYFDGGTLFNESRETNDQNGLAMDHSFAYPSNRIVSVYYSRALYNTGINMPTQISNFENCDLRAAMCCWTQDKQANDDNGDCATPYHENCVDADPADNTDLCYVEMERSPQSNRVAGGLSIFPNDDEGPVHCHGFAWDQDPNDASAVYNGANLFYVSMYDHLKQRGYVRNVPGAPMCACVEQMPVVTRADCTEIKVKNEWVVYNYKEGVGLSATITYVEAEFKSCQGANNNNNDLRGFYERLVNEGRATSDELAELDKVLVGEGNCDSAIKSLMADNGWRRA